MRIEEFQITHYGPLPDRGKISLEDFNLIYGVNETGKTLTLEALTKLLLGKNIKDFKNINRVDQEVDGYIILEAQGEQKKLGRKIHLDDIVPITVSECRNIFIIRNSDLSIEPESSFYTEITNRLTGLQTNRIKNLKEKILEITALTPGGDFSNRKEDGHLKIRMEDAGKLLEDIKSLKSEIEEEQIEEIEQEWVRLFDEIKTKEKLRRKLEEARKRLSYESVASALGKIADGRKSLEDLLVFSEEDFIRWRDAEREIKSVEGELVEIYEVLKEDEENLRTIENNLKERESEFIVAKHKKEKIDGLRSKLMDLKNRQIENSSESSFVLADRQYFFIVSTILALSILGLMLKQIPVFMVLTSVFLVFFFALVGLQLKSKKDRALFGKNFAELKIDLSELGIKGEKIEDFLGEVETFSLKFGEKEGNINIKKVEGGTLRNKIVEIREKRVPELKSKKEQNTEVIHKIKEITFVNNLKEFGESLRKKETIEREDQRV